VSNAAATLASTGSPSDAGGLAVGGGTVALGLGLVLAAGRRRHGPDAVEPPRDLVG
jgi:LPXTG-motif cell wall-anchored protein